LASGVNVPRRCGTASWEPALPDLLIGGLGLDRNNPEDFRRHCRKKTPMSRLSPWVKIDGQPFSHKVAPSKSPASAGEQPGLIAEASG
jgi:hypothetical protein